MNQATWKFIEEALPREIERCKKLLPKYMRESSPKFTTLRTLLERAELGISQKHKGEIILSYIELERFR